MILNPSDFDFLLSKGSTVPIDSRDSILERFDPLLGKPSIAPVAIKRFEPILEKSIQDSDSRESFGDLINTETESEVSTADDSSKNIKLDTDSSLHFGADDSTKSSASETFETASIGEEPAAKRNDTMNIGLINDINNDNNMKSLEQVR